MPAPPIRALPESYFELVRRFPLVQIASDQELDSATAVVHGLLGQDLDAGGEAYLDALSMLIWVYEEEHYPIGDASPAEVLHGLAEANDLTGAEIARRAGIAASTVSAIMSGKRRPTPEQAAALGKLFHLGPAAFISASESGPAKETQRPTRNVKTRVKSSQASPSAPARRGATKRPTKPSPA